MLHPSDPSTPLSPEGDRPRLSLCIATLNRAAQLRDTLAGIAAQWAAPLEVVVVDGASVDDTAGVVAAARTTLPRLTYVRLDARGGFDADYHKAVVAATGDYCWLLSDDDALEPGAIATILAALADRPSLVVVNGAVYDATLSERVAGSQLAPGPDRAFAPDDYQRLFVETANHLSFVGAVVIERELWLARHPERYFGSMFGHVGVIFQAPLPGTAIVLAQPWLKIRAGSASWTQRYFEIWMFLWPELIWSFAALSEESRRAVFAREPWRRPGALLICRAKGSYDLTTFERWIAPRLERGWRRWLARAIAMLPGGFVNAAARVFFNAFRPGARADLLDFDNSPFRRSGTRETGDAVTT